MVKEGGGKRLGIELELEKTRGGGGGRDGHFRRRKFLENLKS